MVKMQVNRDISTKKYLLITIIISLIFVTVSAYNVFSHIARKNYIEVEAEVINIYNRHKGGKYMLYYYEYNGEKYTYEQALLSNSCTIIDDKINVHINPEKPHEVVDTFVVAWTNFINIFLLIFVIVLAKAYKVRKSMEYVKIEDEGENQKDIW